MFPLVRIGSLKIQDIYYDWHHTEFKLCIFHKDQHHVMLARGITNAKPAVSVQYFYSWLLFSIVFSIKPISCITQLG